MGTATTYSTARSAPRGGTSCVLSDCAHNLSRTLAFASVSVRCTPRAHRSPTGSATRAAREHAKNPGLDSNSHANPLFHTLTRYSAGGQACPRSD